MTFAFVATGTRPAAAPAQRWIAALVMALVAPACGGNDKRPSTETTVDATPDGSDASDVSDATGDGTEETAPPDVGPDTTPLTGVHLAIASHDARSCELVVRDPDQVVGAVTFDASVEGRWVDEGLKLALAFFRKADSGFDDGAIALGVAGGEAAAGGLTLEKVTCFDKRGAPLATPGVSILR